MEYKGEGLIKGISNYWRIISLDKKAVGKVIGKAGQPERVREHNLNYKQERKCKKKEAEENISFLEVFNKECGKKI